MFRKYIIKKINKKTQEKMLEHGNMMSAYLLNYVDYIDDKNPFKQYIIYLIENPNIIITLFTILSVFFSSQLLWVFNIYLLFNSFFIALTSFNTNDKNIVQKLSIHVICLCLTQIKIIGTLPTLMICYLLLSIDTNSILFQMITQNMGMVSSFGIRLLPQNIRDLLFPFQKNKSKEKIKDKSENKKHKKRKHK